MFNPSPWVLVKRFAAVNGDSENAVRHKVKNGTYVGYSFITFHVREIRERFQRSVAA